MTSATTLEEVNAELTLRLRQQELAAEFANFSLQTDDLQSVLDEACRTASRGMECVFAKVLEHLPGEDCFLVRAGIGWGQGTVGHAKLGSDLASPAGYAFQTGQPVLSNHLAAETRFRTPDLLVEHGIRRAFNVLIHKPGWRYGVLEVDSPDRHDFTLSDTAFLQTLSATLANAIAQQGRIKELDRSRTFAQSVLDASPDCVKVIDLAGCLELINKNGLCLLEIDDLSQVVGQSWVSSWPDSQRPKVDAALATARSGHVGRFEAFCPTAKGTPKWWDVVVAPIKGGDGQVLSISREITDRMAAAEAKDLLMLEVHHRVKNSLQLVQNLLSLQGRATDNEEAREQLLGSAARVHTIGAIHDRLYKTGSSSLTVEVAPYLEGLVEDLRAGMASTLNGRAIQVEVDAVTWPAGEMTTLGLVATELVTNALKYGAGTVNVTFRQPAGSTGILTVWDEGRSLPNDFDPAQSRGLGMRLIKGLLRGGEAGLEIDRRRGHTCFIAHLPPARTFSP